MEEVRRQEHRALEFLKELRMCDTRSSERRPWVSLGTWEAVVTVCWLRFAVHRPRVSVHRPWGSRLGSWCVKDAPPLPRAVYFQL